MEIDVFWLVLMPLAAALTTGVYMARRDHHQHSDHEKRIQQLETVLVVHANTEQPEAPDLFNKVVEHAGQIATNTQAIAAHGERLDELEKDE